MTLLNIILFKYFKIWYFKKEISFFAKLIGSKIDLMSFIISVFLETNDGILFVKSDTSYTQPFSNHGRLKSNKYGSLQNAFSKVQCENFIDKHLLLDC